MVRCEKCKEGVKCEEFKSHVCKEESKEEVKEEEMRFLVSDKIIGKEILELDPKFKYPSGGSICFAKETYFLIGGKFDK